jgi:hypothetical protein
MLARTGRHRAVGVSGPSDAVLAPEHGMTVLHHDADFEIAAEVRTLSPMPPRARRGF